MGILLIARGELVVNINIFGVCGCITLVVIVLVVIELLDELIDDEFELKSGSFPLSNNTFKSGDDLTLFLTIGETEFELVAPDNTVFKNKSVELLVIVVVGVLSDGEVDVANETLVN